jgi:hypothetical protein
VLVAVYLVVAGQAYGQGCCTAGATSLGLFEGGVRPYGQLTVGINYQFSSLTTAYQGRLEISDPLQRTAGVGVLSLQAEYGLVPRVSILAAIPYSGRSRELTVVSGSGGTQFTETAVFSASGIGDVTFMAKYQVVTPTILSDMEFAIGAGGRLPTGSFTEEREGTQLSIDLQPGTGAPALLGWAYVLFGIPEAGLTFTATGGYRYAGTNFDGYRLGDEWVLLLGGTYQLTEHFLVGLHVRSRFSSQDFANRRRLSATGGTNHDLMPSLTYSSGSSAARIFGIVPLYRNVRGIQLAVTYLIGVEYQHTFDLGTGGDPISIN